MCGEVHPSLMTGPYREERLDFIRRLHDELWRAGPGGLLWPTCLPVQLLREGRHEGLQHGAVVILGTTNTGKTALVNFLLGKQRLPERNRAGVTTSVVGVRLPSGHLVFDTPGLDDREDLEKDLWSYLSTGRNLQGELPLVVDAGDAPLTYWRPTQVRLIVTHPAASRSFWKEVVPGVVERSPGMKVLVAIGRADTMSPSELRDVKLAIQERLREDAPTVRYVGSFSTRTGEGVEGPLGSLLATLTTSSYEDEVRRLWPQLLDMAMEGDLTTLIDKLGQSEELRPLCQDALAGALRLFASHVEFATEEASCSQSGALRAAGVLLSRFLAFGGYSQTWTTEEVLRLCRWSSYVPLLVQYLHKDEPLRRLQHRFTPEVLRLLVLHEVALADGVLDPAEAASLPSLWDVLRFLPLEVRRVSREQLQVFLRHQTPTSRQELLDQARVVARADGKLCKGEEELLERFFP